MEPATRRRLLPIALLALVGSLLVVYSSVVVSAGDGEPVVTEDSMVAARVYSRSGHDVTPLSAERVAELAGVLGAETRRITQNAGTERPFCGRLLHQHEEGSYSCVVCGLPLFHSDDKFDSGTGWPSFTGPVDLQHLAELRDESHGVVRTEIRCARCGAHLGHVFEDGPAPTGQRFCLNSASMAFVAEGAPVPEASQPVAAETAWFAGGCFWGVEDVFAQVPGVLEASSGYSGGELEEPSYEQVCTGRTGHAEVVQVSFDPAVVDYEQLVRLFFKVHDPTTVDRQGPDVGSQYRSAIFTADELQAAVARAVVQELEREAVYGGRSVVTEIEPLAVFYRAEDYHQDYHAKHGGSCALPEW